MTIHIVKWVDVGWSNHLFSLCISGPVIRHAQWWLGIVMHTWGIRIGFGPYNLCLHWK